MQKIGAYLPKESGNHWAAGCEHCKNGIVSAPELTGVCELHLERLAQAINGDVHFCTCKAGERYRVFLLNRRLKLIDEAKRDKRMTDDAQRKTHPEIEWAKRRVTESYAANMPTIHYEEETVTA